jgi:hypothetical protein
MPKVNNQTSAGDELLRLLKYDVRVRDSSFNLERILPHILEARHRFCITGCPDGDVVPADYTGVVITDNHMPSREAVVRQRFTGWIKAKVATHDIWEYPGNHYRLSEMHSPAAAAAPAGERTFTQIKEDAARQAETLVEGTESAAAELRAQLTALSEEESRALDAATAEKAARMEAHFASVRQEISNYNQMMALAEAMSDQTRVAVDMIMVCERDNIEQHQREATAEAQREAAEVDDAYNTGRQARVERCAELEGHLEEISAEKDDLQYFIAACRSDQ